VRPWAGTRRLRRVVLDPVEIVCDHQLSSGGCRERRGWRGRLGDCVIADELGQRQLEQRWVHSRGFVGEWFVRERLVWK
jgi:hypothetical protein